MASPASFFFFRLTALEQLTCLTQKKCKMTAGNLQHIFLAMCCNFLTLLVVWQTSQWQNKHRKWPRRSLALILTVTQQCVVFTLWFGYKKMHFLRLFNIGLTIATLSHLTCQVTAYSSVEFLIFGLILYKVNLLASLMLTHNRESCSIALASLSAVLVLCDAAVGGQSVFLLHFWDIQGTKRGQEETVTWQKDRGGRKK